MKNRILKVLGIIIISVFTMVSVAQAALVAHYKFDGNANDSSGNGNNGTANGATLTTDRNGNSNSAYSFDGVNDFISVNDSDSLDITTSGTIAAWIKVSSGFSGRAGIVSKMIGSDSGQVSYELLYTRQNSGYNEGLIGYVHDGSTTDQFNTYSVDLRGSWHHVAMTWDGNNIKGYYDGNLFNSKAQTGNGAMSSSFDVFIGKTILSGSSYYVNGSIDEVRIYNTALSATEVGDLYDDSGDGSDDDTCTNPFDSSCNDDSDVPTGVSASTSTSSVTLGWNAVSGASGYKVYYGVRSGTYLGSIDVGNVTSKTFTNVADGTYYVAVASSATSGFSSTESDKSSEVEVVVSSVPAPTGFSANVTNNDVDLSWSAASFGSNIAGYKLYYGASSGNYSGVINLGNVTSVSYGNIADGTYYVAITAYTSAGEESAKSTELTLTFPDLTICGFVC